MKNAIYVIALSVLMFVLANVASGQESVAKLEQRMTELECAAKVGCEALFCTPLIRPSSGKSFVNTLTYLGAEVEKLTGQIAALERILTDIEEYRTADKEHREFVLLGKKLSSFFINFRTTVRDSENSSRASVQSITSVQLINSLFGPFKQIEDAIENSLQSLDEATALANRLYSEQYPVDLLESTWDEGTRNKALDRLTNFNMRLRRFKMELELLSVFFTPKSASNAGPEFSIFFNPRSEEDGSRVEIFTSFVDRIGLWGQMLVIFKNSNSSDVFINLTTAKVYGEFFFKRRGVEEFQGMTLRMDILPDVDQPRN